MRMSSVVWTGLAAVCFSGLWAGCQQAVDRGRTTQVDDATDAAAADSVESGGTAGTTEVAAANIDESQPPKWRTEVQLAQKSWQETKELLATQRGKVVVLDVWSTACEPCLREFPKLVELQNEWPDDVVCVGVNCDFAGVRRKPPEFYLDRVMNVLNTHAAHILNVMCSDPADELFQALKIDSIPAVFVYDRDGNLAGTFDNRTNESAEFTYEDDILPLIRRLVEDPVETAAVE